MDKRRGFSTKAWKCNFGDDFGDDFRDDFGEIVLPNFGSFQEVDG